MRKGGQKAKGSTHQRRVARMFTGAYYPDDDGEFKSTPGSGGWDKRVAPGDIIAFKYTSADKDEMVIDRSFPLVVECKDWKDKNVKHFVSGLYAKECQLFGWMEQAIDDCVQARNKVGRKIPVVVFKLYRTENVVMIQSIEYSELTQMFGQLEVKRYVLKLIREEGEEAWNLIFILLSDFLDWIDWDFYKEKPSRK